MDVRLARPTDAPLVLALALEKDSHLVGVSGWPNSNTVVRSVTQSLLPLALRSRSWLARDGSSVALLEAAPRRYVIGWDITRLVVRGDPTFIVPPMVQAATDHVRSKGVPRLFARCCPEASDVLREVGFQPLAREYLLQGPVETVRGERPLPEGSRYRMPQDSWPLHQLESAVTPPMVRQLEGLTSLDWSQKSGEMSEIVVESEGRVCLWVGWGAKLGHNLTQIGMLAHPDFRESAPDLLHHVLINSPPGTTFLARVRDYQSDALAAFLGAGFGVVGEEILMIKHARLELARARGRVKVAPIPSIHVFQSRIGRTADRVPVAALQRSLKDEIS